MIRKISEKERQHVVSALQMAVSILTDNRNYEKSTKKKKRKAVADKVVSKLFS